MVRIFMDQTLHLLRPKLIQTTTNKLQTITPKLQNQCAVRAMNTVGWVVCQRPLAVLVNNCLAQTIKM
jgi:hypothetical protein